MLISMSGTSTGDYKSFGPYEIYERLGIGGMATVHRAKERGIEGFERIVALKRLLPHLAEDTNFVNSFVREAKLASLLQHANIVQLYELGRVGAEYFISMEYIDGCDLRKVLRQARKVTGPPPMSVFLALMLQLCDALDYAHNRTDQSGRPLRIVHRDVSPSNLLITRSGHLKVIDFGIAKAQAQHPHTQTGKVKGKLAYMAPEALKGQNCDARSDIFSVGIVAHELLTARPLFASRNDYQTILRLQQMKVEAPSAYSRKCPREVDEIVLKALERDPAQRWQSAADLRDVLHYVQSRYQVSATNRDVASWQDWAFALEAPKTGSFAAVSSTPVSRSRPGSQSQPAIAPARAFARAPSSITPAERATPVSDPGSNAAPLPPPPAGPLALDTGAVKVDSGAVDALEGGADSSADELSEEALDSVWGTNENESGIPVILEDVPDVSKKLVALGGAEIEIEIDESLSPSVLTTQDSVTTEFLGLGSGIGADGQKDNPRRRRRRFAIALGVAGAVAAAGLALVWATTADTTSPAAAVPISRTATLKFVVEPEDAAIVVAGLGSHRGSPHKLEVAAPGSYRVEIARQDYKSYVTSILVEGGENHVVRVALEASKNDRSQVTIKLVSDELMVYLDGEPLPDNAMPASAEVSPGGQVLSVRNRDNEELWSQEFDAKANTNYEFEPSIKRTRKRRSSRDKGEQESDEDSSQPEIEMPLVIEDGTPELDDQDSPVKASPSVLNVQPRTPLALASLPETEPPSAPVVQATRKGPVTILPHQAKKRSGSLPSISTKNEDVPGHASAKLCIDTQGAVTSVEMLTPMPWVARNPLVRSLRTWRYAPHLAGGEPVSACFAVNFQIAKSPR